MEITGTAAITSFGGATNKMRFVRFAGALTLTHNATSLVLLTRANRTTVAGDVGIYISDNSGNWREWSYSGTAPMLPAQGIKFPATQIPSADPNTLDDYEEGTWTPKVTGSTSGEATYTVQSGYYRKIGDFVFAYFSITTSGVAALVGTRAEVSNFPFACSSTANDNGTGVFGSVSGLTLSSGTQFGGLMVTNATSMRIQFFGSGVSSGSLSPSALANTTVLSGFCAYHI